MKRIAMLFTVVLLLVPAIAHNRTVVKKLDEVLRLRNGAGVHFTDVNLSKKVKYVMKLRRGEKGKQSFFLFSAKGDWGPFSGLITLKGGSIMAVDILSFTRHSSDGLMKPAFLGQFTGLSMMAFHMKKFKSVPGEPINLEALKEAVMLAFHNGMNIMKGGHGGMMKSSTDNKMKDAGYLQHHGMKPDGYTEPGGCSGCSGQMK